MGACWEGSFLTMSNIQYYTDMHTVYMYSSYFKLCVINNIVLLFFLKDEPTVEIQFLFRMNS